LREDLLRARHRLGKLPLRRGLVWQATKAWTQAHRRWLRSLTCEHAADQAVLSDYRLGMEQLEARLETVDAALVAESRMCGDSPRASTSPASTASMPSSSRPSSSRSASTREAYQPLRPRPLRNPVRERTLASLRQCAASLGFELLQSPGS